jgi:hypothetical protein
VADENWCERGDVIWVIESDRKMVAVVDAVNILRKVY